MINNLRVICIIQARMSSQRLPKKALADLNGTPAIIWMIQRVKKSNLIDKTSHDKDLFNSIKALQPLRFDT